MKTGLHDRLRATKRERLAPDTWPMAGFNQQSAALHDSGGGPGRESAGREGVG